MIAKGYQIDAQPQQCNAVWQRRSVVVASSAAPGPTPSSRGRAVPSSRAIRTSMPAASPDVHKWTGDYAAQPNAAAELAGGGDAGAPPFILPIMGLKKTKLPTETVQLQIFEPRYRLMFRLVNQSRSRRFGVALTDSEQGLMEEVGALCELTHFVPVPERQRIFISARCVGRYKVEKLISDKPFVAARCLPYADEAPADVAAQAQLAALEAHTWQALQDVRQLTSKLFLKDSGTEFGPEVFSLETRRWCPDPAVRSAVQVAAGSDPTLLQACEQMGLMGKVPESGAPREGASEHICSDAARDVGDAERRERLSFALLGALDADEAARLEALQSRSTAERLRAVEQAVLEGRAHLAARSSLRDMFGSSEG